MTRAIEALASLPRDKPPLLEPGLDDGDQYQLVSNTKHNNSGGKSQRNS